MTADRIKALEYALVLCQIEVDRGQRNGQTGYQYGASECRHAVNAALAASRAATDCHQQDLVTADRVRVKPLVWEDVFPESMSAATPFGEYVVETDDNGIWGMWSPEEGFGYDPVSEHTCGPSAKAAAQADYEARILAALDLTPAPAVKPVAMTAQDAARVLLAAIQSQQIDPFDASDLVVEALAVKHAGNRGDAVAQLEIAEQFFAAALRAIGGDA